MFRYPILSHLAPELSGFVWIKDVIERTDKNLEAIVNLHKRRDENHDSALESSSSYIDLYLQEIHRAVGDDEKCYHLHKALIASLKNGLAGREGIN